MAECKAACRLHLIILNRRNIGSSKKKLAQVLHDLVLCQQYAKWYLPLCNNNLAAHQRKFETSIFLWKSRHGGRLAGSSVTMLIGEHKLPESFEHLPGNWCFTSTKNQRSLWKIQKPAAALVKAKICPFSSTFLKFISWDSPFNCIWIEEPNWTRVQCRAKNCL